MTKEAHGNWDGPEFPGRFLMLPKGDIRVHPRYQRDPTPSKVKNIAKDWNWIGCGVLTVAYRGGEYWIVDGQHRMLAAQKVLHITCLPCMVFDTTTASEEAFAFMLLNKNRKPITALDMHKTAVEYKDPVAVFIDGLFTELGIVVTKTASRAGQLKAVGFVTRMAGANKESFERVFRFAVEISNADDIYIQERLMGGLWYLHENIDVDGGLENRKLRERLKAVGARRLIDEANKAAAYYSRGGAKVWAKGMLDAINFKLRNKFSFKDQ